MAIMRSNGVTVSRMDGEDDEMEVEDVGPTSDTSSSQSGVAANSDEEAAEFEDGDDEEDEEDEEDSGMGSDELDITELGEAGAELCQVNNNTFAVPLELYDLPGLNGVLSMDTWNNCLSEEERVRLAAFLPDMDQETFSRTLTELFDGKNFHFGSPVSTLFERLKGGLCDPRLALYRKTVDFVQRRKHYHVIRRYHNGMVAKLVQIQDVWKGCAGYGVEEKLRALEAEKSQGRLLGHQNGLGVGEESETDSDSRDWEDRYWQKQYNDRKTRTSSDDVLVKKVGKLAKDKLKGVVRVPGQRDPLALKHDVGSKPRMAVTLSGLSRQEREQRSKHSRSFYGDDMEEDGCEISLQRDQSAAQRGSLKSGKRKGMARSYDYQENSTRSPYYQGKKNAQKGATVASYNSPYFQSVKKAKYSDEDYQGKGMQSKAVKGDQMDWSAVGHTDKSEDWQKRGKRWELGADFRSEKPKVGYDPKVKPYKSIAQQIDGSNFASDYRSKPSLGKNKGYSAKYGRMGLEPSRGGQIFAHSEETESDSSEQFEEDVDVNPLQRKRELLQSGVHRPMYDTKRPDMLIKKEYPVGVDSDFITYPSKGARKSRTSEPSYLRDVQVQVAMKDQVSGMMRPSSIKGSERQRKGMMELDMREYENFELNDTKKNVSGIVGSLESERLVGRQAYEAHISDGEASGLERTNVPLMGCTSGTKKSKRKSEVVNQDELDESLSGSKLQPDDSSVTMKKKKGKKRAEGRTDPVTMATLDPVVPEKVALEVEPEKPPKKTYTPITPTLHTGFSFSIVHLLSAVRKAMVTSTEDPSVVGRHPDQEDKKADNTTEEQNKTVPELSGSQQQQSEEKRDVSTTDQTEQDNSISLTVQEIVDRVRSNPGDPCILEMQEPLQDLVRGVLKIFIAKTAPLGAKAWKPLVTYEKSNKSWQWVGPPTPSSSDSDPIEEETSPEAWGIPHKMLQKLVDSFAIWLKNGQETLKQIGSLPPPPASLLTNLDDKERFKDVKAQKSMNTFAPSSEEVKAYFRQEETLRYSIPDRAFAYTAADGRKTMVAPLRRGGGKPTSKAREHDLLKHDRPPHVTILCLVRDAAARLPGSIGTRADVCTLLRDSQYVVEESTDAFVNSVVSGALDRLHYERDPCVHYIQDRKLWEYLHRDRVEEDFDDDGTSSTKKWKRPKKDATDPSGTAPDNDAGNNATEDTSVIGLSDTRIFDSDLNLAPPSASGEEMSELVFADVRPDIGNISVLTAATPVDGSQSNPAIWEPLPKQEDNMVCHENSTNEDFDDEAFSKEQQVGLLSTSLL